MRVIVKPYMINYQDFLNVFGIWNLSRCSFIFDTESFVQKFSLKGFLENVRKFTGNTCFGVSFTIKLQAWDVQLY